MLPIFIGIQTMKVIKLPSSSDKRYTPNNGLVKWHVFREFFENSIPSRDIADDFTNPFSFSVQPHLRYSLKNGCRTQKAVWFQDRSVTKLTLMSIRFVLYVESFQAEPIEFGGACPHSQPRHILLLESVTVKTPYALLLRRSRTWVLCRPRREALNRLANNNLCTRMLSRTWFRMQ